MKTKTKLTKKEKLIVYAVLQCVVFLHTVLMIAHLDTVTTIDTFNPVLFVYLFGTGVICIRMIACYPKDYMQEDE